MPGSRSEATVLAVVVVVAMVVLSTSVVSMAAVLTSSCATSSSSSPSGMIGGKSAGLRVRKGSSPGQVTPVVQKIKKIIYKYKCQAYCHTLKVLKNYSFLKKNLIINCFLVD